jgi:hypothetical protein
MTLQLDDLSMFNLAKIHLGESIKLTDELIEKYGVLEEDEF